MNRPISRLLAISGAGGVIGALAVGGPIGIVGGLLLGGFAEEVIARARSRRATVAGSSMGWDQQGPHARFHPYVRRPSFGTSYGADPTTTAANLQAQLNQLEVHSQSGNVGQTIAQAAQVTAAVTQIASTAVDTANAVASLLGSL
jgi:hypothetical protein